MHRVELVTLKSRGHTLAHGENPRQDPPVKLSGTNDRGGVFFSQALPERRLVTAIVRYSPLHQVHEDLGAGFTDFAGWQMPVRYSSDLAEHHAVREAAGIFDISHMAEISVAGPDAAAYLDYAVSTQVSADAVGRARYSLLLNEAGGIIDDLIVYRLSAEHFLVVANAGNRFNVFEALVARSAGYNVEVRDQSDATAMIAVQGPSSRGVLEQTVGLSVDVDSPGRFTSSLTELGYYWIVPGIFLGNPVLIARTGYTGEDGFEIYIDTAVATDLWTALTEAGQPLGLVPCGLACRDTLRLEAGMPLYGHELDLTTRADQAGLARSVHLDKPGDFVGRAASETSAPAHAPVLVGLAGEGKRAARAGYEVFAGDNAVGEVTSGALSPTLGFPIALAYVASENAVIGTVLEVDIRGTRLPYTVVKLPFYKRKK
jgi:aminomethyltransferase